MSCDQSPFLKYENQFLIKLSTIIDNIKDSVLFCVVLKQLYYITIT